ncbi:MAG: Fur family transcriptional regulator [Armatimonadota bacterium]|nr:Fur family transcriptional regulator [Armatimonadota bacterium]MDR5696467.1 Fur family transcriptional regulator [Armatimonadota bacterium]
MDIITQTRRELAATGRRVTPQRLAVYGALRRARDHPSAEDVYRSVRRTHPTMSRATVYRALDLFASLGLVEVFRGADGVARYDPHPSSHVNLECAVCGRIEDVSDPGLQTLAQRTAQRVGFALAGLVVLRGRCRMCAAAPKTATPNRKGRGHHG